MASFKAKKVVASLLKKGFIRQDSHHQYYEFWHNEKVISRTYTSHGGEDIGDYLLSAMRKQCNMDKDFFIEFIQCTKSKEDYIDLLIQNDLIDKI